MRKVSHGNANQLDGYDKIEKRYGRQGRVGTRKYRKKNKKTKNKKDRSLLSWLAGERGLCVSVLCLLCAVVLSPALWCSVGVSQRQSKERKKIKKKK